MKEDNEFLNRVEVEIEHYPNGWCAFRFGILVAHSFKSRKGLIGWLKEYFS